MVRRDIPLLYVVCSKGRLQTRLDICTVWWSYWVRENKLL